MEICISCVQLRKIIVSSIRNLEDFNKKIFSVLQNPLIHDFISLDVIDENELLLLKTIQEMKIKLVEESEDLGNQPKKVRSKLATPSSEEVEIVDKTPENSSVQKSDGSNMQMPAVIIQVVPPIPSEKKTTGTQTNLMFQLKPLKTKSQNTSEPIPTNNNNFILRTLLSPRSSKEDISILLGGKVQLQPLQNKIPNVPENVPNVSLNSNNSNDNSDVLTAFPVLFEHLIPPPSVVVHHHPNSTLTPTQQPVHPKDQNRSNLNRTLLPKPIQRTISPNIKVTDPTMSQIFIQIQPTPPLKAPAGLPLVQKGILSNYLSNSSPSPNPSKRHALPNYEEIVERAKKSKIEENFQNQISEPLLSINDLTLDQLNDKIQIDLNSVTNESGIVVALQNKRFIVPLSENVTNQIGKFTKPEELQEIKMGFVILSFLARKRKLIRAALVANVSEVKNAFAKTNVVKAFMIYKYLNRKQKLEQSSQQLGQTLNLDNMNPQLQIQPPRQFSNVENMQNQPIGSHNAIENIDMIMHGVTEGGQFKFPQTKPSTDPLHIPNKKEIRNLNNKMKINCPLPHCKFKSDNLPNLEAHYDSTHKIPGVRIQMESFHKCSICGTSFLNFPDFVVHLKTHLDFVEIDEVPEIPPEPEKDELEKQSALMEKLFNVDPSLSSKTTSETTNELLRLLSMNSENEAQEVQERVQKETEKPIVENDIEIIDISSGSNSPNHHSTNDVFPDDESLGIFQKGLQNIKTEKEGETSNSSFNVDLSDCEFSANEFIKTEIFLNTEEYEEMEKDPFEFL